MSGGDEQVECPLCMEPLEIDDINFFPCTCGYQICRFCWHRIRTDENGLCPACRKQYPEDPAEFKPLTEDELQRIKKERRQKDLQRKQKAAENRKHLANVRVVQRNLVFVVGLSQRLADPEVLKKHEYFGKFGKIHKVVINQSTSYAGAQGPSASAYVTYNKSEDALKAIIAVNNVHIDGRTLKASLGTTKYCSHFLRGTQCMKTDCMYLHELGEEAASFTKEEMQVGKHQEYEQKLLEQYMNSQNAAHNVATNNRINTTRKKNSSPTNIVQNSQQHSPPQSAPTSSPPTHIHTQPPPIHPDNNTNKEAWPSLQPGGKGQERLTNGNRPPPNIANYSHQPDRGDKSEMLSEQNRAPGNQKRRTTPDGDSQIRSAQIPVQNTDHNTSPGVSPRQSQPQGPVGTIGSKRKSLGLDNPDSLSLFSSTNGYHGARNPKPPVQVPEPIPNPEISETIPVSSSTDWQAAFGFGSKNKDWQDDDLGFDPLEESSRGLADLLEKENGQKSIPANPFMGPFQGPPPTSRPMPPHNPQNPPPGFSLNHIQQQPHVQQQHQQQTPPMFRPDVLTSRMMGFMPPLHSAYQDMLTDMSKDHMQQNVQNDVFNMKDWQDGLRALLPNINISFGGPPQNQSSSDTRTNTSHSNQSQNNWCPNSKSQSDSSWGSCDPAILSSGNIADGSLLENSPHWLKSLNQLTEMDTPASSHRLPFVQQLPMRNAVWPPQTHNPPPGFQTHIRPPLQTAEPHKISEGLQ